MKKSVLGLLIASCSFGAIAAESGASNNWVGGIGFMQLSDEVNIEGTGMRLNAIVTSLGYKPSSCIKIS